MLGCLVRDVVPSRVFSASYSVATTLSAHPTVPAAAAAAQWT
jgi:hypothetical protein